MLVGSLHAMMCYTHHVSRVNSGSYPVEQQQVTKKRNDQGVMAGRGRCCSLQTHGIGESETVRGVLRHCRKGDAGGGP